LDPVSISLSIAALVVSIASTIATSRISSRQNALQEQMLALETAREQDRRREAESAQVTASIERWGREHRLRIQNSGSVTARNVRVLMDGKPLREHELILQGEDEISVLGPGVDATYILAVAQQSPGVVLVRIEWSDDSADNRIWESQLKVF
jgi:hypothetical protein